MDGTQVRFNPKKHDEHTRKKRKFVGNDVSEKLHTEPWYLTLPMRLGVISQKDRTWGHIEVKPFSPQHFEWMKGFCRTQQRIIYNNFRKQLKAQGITWRMIKQKFI